MKNCCHFINGLSTTILYLPVTTFIHNQTKSYTQQTNKSNVTLCAFINDNNDDNKYMAKEMLPIELNQICI